MGSVLKGKLATHQVIYYLKKKKNTKENSLPTPKKCYQRDFFSWFFYFGQNMYVSFPSNFEGL